MSTTPAQTTEELASTPRTEHPGMPLVASAGAFAAAFLASILVGPISGLGPIPSPFSAADVIQDYFAAGQEAAAVGGFLQVLAGIALLVLSAGLSSRLQFLLPRQPGPLLAGFGGLAASILLTFSGLLQALLARPEVVAANDLLGAVQYFMFLTGGPAHTSALGVAVVAIALSVRSVGLPARWIPMTGIVIGIIAILSCAAVALPAAAPAIPIGRYLALLWLLLVAIMLPRGRNEQRAAT